MSRWLLRIARLLIAPGFHVWFGLRVTGAENIPREGPAIIAPNHKSFLDPFFVGLATRRPVRYLAKDELFKPPFGGLLLRLGAFPIRRGSSDAVAMETARTILRQGGLLVVFPEGTRVEDPDALGAPHHGAARLALDTGAPLVPAVISGSDHLWFGPLPKPRRVRLTLLAPLDVGDLRGQEDAVSELIDRELWPAVINQYGRQVSAPGLILSALVALGVGGGLLARRQARAKPRLLGVVAPRKLRRRRRTWFR